MNDFRPEVNEWYRGTPPHPIELTGASPSRPALQSRGITELKELASFWDGRRAPPEAKGALVGDLQRRMSNEKSVRRRVKFLSKKLVDLLKFFLRGEGYRAELGHVTGSKSFAYLSPFELKAAINALGKRGFLFASTAVNGTKNGTTYLVPCELGDVLQTFIWDDDRTVEEIFRLRGQLARIVDRNNLDSLLHEHLGPMSTPTITRRPPGCSLRPSR